MTPPASDPTDADLVREALAGDVSAFGRLIERHFGAVHAIALAKLRDAEAAQDLVQEVFLRVQLNLGRLGQADRFAPWVCRIARNLATDWLRRGARSSRLIAQVQAEAPMPAAADFQAKGVREAMEAEEEARHLRRAIFALPEDQCTAVLLHFAEGLTQREIADRLGIGQATVSRQIRRALAALRGALEPALRRAGPSLGPAPGAMARSITLASAVGAMSASAKATLAASVTVGEFASAPTTAGALSSLMALIAGGGAAVTTTKGIVAAGVTVAVVAIAIAGVVGYTHVKSPDQPPDQARGSAQESQSPQGEAVTLRRILPLGSEWGFHTVTEVDRTIPTPSQGEMHQEMAMEFSGHQRVIEVARDGGATIEEVTTSVRMTRMVVNGQPYDQAALDAASSRETGSRLWYDIDSQGGIGWLHFAGWRHFSDVDPISADQFLQDLYTRLLCGFPDHPVRPGDSWTHEIPFRGGGDEPLMCTSTLDRVEEADGHPVAVIRREAQLAHEDPTTVSIPEAPGVTTIHSVTGPVTAEDRLLLDTGQLLRSTMEADLTIPTGLRRAHSPQDSISNVRQRTSITTDYDHSGDTTERP
jgi:RNA polymerase sigma factor (sigma-70 family)